MKQIARSAIVEHSAAADVSRWSTTSSPTRASCLVPGAKVDDAPGAARDAEGRNARPAADVQHA